MDPRTDQAIISLRKKINRLEKKIEENDKIISAISHIVETLGTGWSFHNSKVIGTVFKDEFVWHVVYRGG